MNIETLREHSIFKAKVTVSFPFDNDTLVFKIGQKIFLLTSLSNPQTSNVKCNAERAIVLREEFEDINPGFYMNKKHWNTISFIRLLNDNMLFILIGHSYDLVLKKFSKNIQQEIKDL